MTIDFSCKYICYYPLTYIGWSSQLFNILQKRTMWHSAGFTVLLCRIPNTQNHLQNNIIPPQNRAFYKITVTQQLLPSNTAYVSICIHSSKTDISQREILTINTQFILVLLCTIKDNLSQYKAIILRCQYTFELETHFFNEAYI